MAYFISGIALGEVSTERHSLKGDIDAFPMPGAVSSGCQLTDYGGVLRKIHLEGEYNAASEQALQNLFIIPLESVLNGNQTGTIFYSPFMDLASGGSYSNGSIAVMVEDFQWTYSKGAATTATWALELVEGHI